MYESIHDFESYYRVPCKRRTVIGAFVMKTVGNILAREHGWKLILQVAHWAGLISLPGFHKHAWKNSAHRYYSRFVTVFTVVNSMSLVSNMLIHSIKDTGEFCQRSFEDMLFLFVTLKSLYVRYNLEKLLRMVDFFQTVCVYHRNESVIRDYKRREKNWMLLMFVLIVITYTGLVVIVPNLSKSQVELESLKRIYHWKNPGNTLPLFLYTPFIDPSDGRVYRYLYLMEAYWALLLTVQVAISFANFALSPYSLRAHYDVLNKYTQMLGTVHTNAVGQHVFHKNIMKAQYVEVDSDDIAGTNIGRKGKMATQKYLQYLHVQYDHYYLRQIVRYHQKLKLMRNQLDTFLKCIWAFLTTLMGGRLCIALYAILIPGVLPKFARDKMVMEATSFSLVCFTVFYGGEVLAATVPSWNLALNQSCWYNCSQDTRKLFPLLVQISQREKYLSVKDVIPLSYSFMLSLIKATYSVFNLLRLRSETALKL